MSTQNAGFYQVLAVYLARRIDKIVFPTFEAFVIALLEWLGSGVLAFCADKEAEGQADRQIDTTN